MIPNSDGAPVNIEFIIYVYGELGKPNQNQLIEKVQKYLIEDRSLHETWSAIKGNCDWRSKRIPKYLLDDSDINLAQAAPTDLLNGQYVHLCRFMHKFD